MKYFILTGKDQKGPFDLDELRGQNITSKTQVWKEGMESWSTAGAIPELSALFTPPPVTPPPFRTSNKNKRLYIIGGLIVAICIIIVAIYALNQRNTAIQLQQQSVVEQENQQQLQQQNQEDQAKLIAQQRQAKIQYLNDHFNQLVPVSVDYNKKTLGGFDNVFVTVQNNSDYDLQNVIVDIKYLTATGAICQEGQVTFADIPPNSKQTQRGDNSNRGSMLRFNILKDHLHCTSLGF
jgi:hypothetical protein